jgi:hypothetical protein
VFSALATQAHEPWISPNALMGPFGCIGEPGARDAAAFGFGALGS